MKGSKLSQDKGKGKDVEEKKVAEDQKEKSFSEEVLAKGRGKGKKGGKECAAG